MQRDQQQYIETKHHRHRALIVGADDAGLDNSKKVRVWINRFQSNDSSTTAMLIIDKTPGEVCTVQYDTLLYG